MERDAATPIALAEERPVRDTFNRICRCCWLEFVGIAQLGERQTEDLKVGSMMPCVDFVESVAATLL